MDAYTAVHSQEAKEELNSQRDLISEMNTARLKDDDLRNIAEEVLEVVLEEVSVSEAEDIISNLVPESSIVGRQEKLQRILEAFGETFSRIKLKNKDQALEEFVKYRQQKRLSETWSTRHNQDKRVQRLHSTVVAEDSAIIKNGLLKMFNEKKSDPCWDSHKQVGMKKKGGKMVPNCVPKNEEFAAEGIRDMDPEKGTKERKAKLEKKRGMKMDDHPQYKKEEVGQVDENRAAARAAGGYKDDSKKQPDPSKAGFTGIGNMSIDQIRKMSARMDKEKTKKEEYVAEKKGSKPDYLDFDGDGNKEESMKKALNDKKKKGMKEELETSGKFSETEILKIIASL
jgi:hypothetical protein